MRKLAWPTFGFLFLAVMQPAHAAKQLGPPIAELLSDPGRTRIVIAVASQKTDAGRIQFSVNERLSGDSPDSVLLRTDETTVAEVVVGQSYVVAWTYLRRNRSVIGGWEKDPEGPAIVNILGLGSAALFEDNPSIRFLFTNDASTERENASQWIDALLGQMTQQDSRSRGLVIMELYLRPELATQMSRSQANALNDVFKTKTLAPQHRDFLLRSALHLDPDLTSPWLGEEFRRVIIEHGTQYDLRTFVPGLVRTAAQGLQQTGGPSDMELLSILLYANNPGVAKAALATMDHIDSGATVIKAQQAIRRGWIHGETRLALQHYLGN